MILSYDGISYFEMLKNRISISVSFLFEYCFSYITFFFLEIFENFFLTDPFRKKTNFKTLDKPKMKFDFEAFQNKMQITSHEKIIFHMLFGAFLPV